MTLPTMKSVRAKKARNHEEGADDQLHLALAMLISKQEQERMRRESIGEGDKRRITVYQPVLDLSQDDEVEMSVSNVII